MCCILILRVFGLSKQLPFDSVIHHSLVSKINTLQKHTESFPLLDNQGMTFGKNIGEISLLSDILYGWLQRTTLNLCLYHVVFIDHMAEATVFISVRMRWRSSWQRWKPFAPAAAVRVNWVATCRRFHGPMVFAITRIFRSWMVPFGCKMLGPIPSSKLTWQWKIPMFNGEYIFNRSIFHCHVSLPEGNRLRSSGFAMIVPDNRHPIHSSHSLQHNDNRWPTFSVVSIRGDILATYSKRVVGGTKRPIDCPIIFENYWTCQAKITPLKTKMTTENHIQMVGFAWSS